ncbi:hypothetical protein [Calothrix rhizosoleniae]|nr:hypothetical protein [Calothrix rhizosoleniae]
MAMCLTPHLIDPQHHKFGGLYAFLFRSSNQAIAHPHRGGLSAMR